MKKLLVTATLLLLGLVSIGACSTADTAAAETTPDQKSSAESLQAVADASIETAAAATETQAASLDTDIPSPSPTSTPKPTLPPTETPTSEPTPTPEPTQTPSPTPIPLVFPFSSTLPIRWEYKDGETEEIMEINEIYPRGGFRGYFENVANDSKGLMAGTIIYEFGEGELEKWEFIEGFGTDIGGTWIRFKGSSIVQGQGMWLYSLLYAHVDEDGKMRGVNFNDYLGFTNAPGRFEWAFTDQ